jgi:hypothetical protein
VKFWQLSQFVEVEKNLCAIILDLNFLPRLNQFLFFIYILIIWNEYVRNIYLERERGIDNWTKIIFHRDIKKKLGKKKHFSY